jgi:L-asparagine transporter-like permease
MFRNNRTMTYVVIGIVGVALALAFGFNPAFLLVLAICPLMMFFMMRSMGNMGGHDHGSRDTDRDSDDRVDRDANTGR